MPRSRRRRTKLARLVALPIRARKPKVAAAQHLVADVEIQCVAMGHHKKSAPATLGRGSADNSSRNVPSRSAGQCRRRVVGRSPP